MSARLPAVPDKVLCHECRHYSHNIKFYHCLQCHQFQVYLYPNFKDTNRIYDD
jgi:hypothetical protein